MREVLTTCTADCPGTCSIIAQVENGRVTKLQGNSEHEITRGFICGNTRSYLKKSFYSKRRILHPLKKEDGEWIRISWDEALDVTADKIRNACNNYGSQSILYYQGYGARTALRIINRRFFNLLGGVSTLYGSICGGTGQAGQEMDMGVRISHDPTDHLNSNVILIWGRNPAVTDIHLWKILLQARKKGAKLVTIDPVTSETAKRSDMHLQPAPGSDGFLAMAMAIILLKDGSSDKEFITSHTKYFKDYIEFLNEYSLNELSKITDVPLNELYEITRWYATGNPSSIILGWGLQRYQQSHLTFRFIDALAAITGNIGKSGGGVSHGFDEYGYFDHRYALDAQAPNQRKITIPIAGKSILQMKDPPIKLIFITAGNPLAMLANSSLVKKAFQSVDDVIMVDHFLNDTADVANLFLPATTFLEDEDLVGSYGHNWISPLNPVIEPLGESRSELRILQELSTKLGFKDGKFKTESGKYEFPGKLNIKNGNMTLNINFRQNDEFNLRLLSVSPREWIGSEIPENEHKNGVLSVQVHPKILKERNIEENEEIWLESQQGKLLVKAEKNATLRTDYVLTNRGGWNKYNKCVNILTPDLISDCGNGAPYYETFVKMKKKR
jgi:anaerobic selenocysteine-containing dehydrogenase